MNNVKAMGMSEEDSLISKIFIGFMATPLVLLVVAGALQAMSGV